MSFLLLFAISSAAFFIIRIFPYWKIRQQGCDAYYFLLSSEIFRKNKKLPITIPYYLMEEKEQSYPPGFSIFCALFPEKFLKKYHWLFNHIIEWATATLGFWVTYEITESPVYAALSVLLYALQPGIITELRALTSRCLAMFLFHIFFLLIYCALSIDIFFFAGTAVVGAILIYTHKLTMQVTWFVCPLMSAFTQQWEWVLALPASYVLAGILYPTYFYKIQRHHWDMIFFWVKNWKNLGRHHIYDSPLYKNEEKSKKAFYSAESPAAWFLYAKRLIFENPYAVFALLLLISTPGSFFPAQITLLEYQTGIFFTAAAIVYLPFLRGIGSGWQYMKYAALPTSVFVASAFSLQDLGWIHAFLILAFMLSLFYYLKTTKAISQNHPHIKQDDSDFTALTQTIAALPENVRLLCLPLEICDPLVYQTRHTVMWGSHSYPFSRIENFFPIVNRKLSDFITHYKISHLVLDTDYIDPQDIDIKTEIVHRCGRYVIYSA